MPLEVLPVTLADFDDFEKFTEEQGGTLVSPLSLAIWPVSTPQDAARRNKWSIDRQRDQFQNDKAAHFVKVVDTDLKHSDQTIALVRWHYYPDGILDPNTGLGVKSTNSSTQEPSFPEGLDVEARSACIAEIAKYHRVWNVTSEKCWSLVTVVTRTAHRRRGAASLLTKFRADRAAADGCVAFLDADPAAQSIYAKQGFIVHGVIKGDTLADGLVQMYKPPPTNKVD